DASLQDVEDASPTLDPPEQDPKTRRRKPSITDFLHKVASNFSSLETESFSLPFSAPLSASHASPTTPNSPRASLMDDCLSIDTLQWVPFAPKKLPWRGAPGLRITNTNTLDEDPVPLSPSFSLKDEHFVSIDCSGLAQPVPTSVASQALLDDVVYRSDSKICLDDKVSLFSFHDDTETLDLRLELPMIQRTNSSSSTDSNDMCKTDRQTKLQDKADAEPDSNEPLAPEPPQPLRRTRSSSVDALPSQMPSAPTPQSFLTLPHPGKSQSYLSLLSLSKDTGPIYTDPCTTAYKNYCKQNNSLARIRSFMSRTRQKSNEPPRWAIDIAPDLRDKSLFTMGSRFKSMLSPPSPPSAAPILQPPEATGFHAKHGSEETLATVREDGADHSPISSSRSDIGFRYSMSEISFFSKPDEPIHQAPRRNTTLSKMKSLMSVGRGVWRNSSLRKPSRAVLDKALPRIPFDD
ncbi:hypothetical protein HDU91_002357, partial [Kappamyces sp. JEL0680]